MTPESCITNESPGPVVGNISMHYWRSLVLNATQQDSARLVQDRDHRDSDWDLQQERDESQAG